mmetsp:Transcript_59899/g.128522  ORF Transcript_59899/g.128522 Transcript_59899/m.128522 type:complete len:235 (+) Transcript_59899:95-799(+)
MMAAGEEDPFAEFLSQDQGGTGPPLPTYAAEQAPGADDAGMQLRLLVECARRQEELLGKVCGLLVGLDDKMGRLAASQERLESQFQTLPAQGAGAGAPRSAVPRGNLVPPPGKSPLGGSGGPGPAASPVQSAEEQRMVAEKMAAERLRIEEEGRRRAEELARRREEEEKRRQEEAERQRLEEERRKEEERLRKAQLEKKTTGLMGDLMSGSSGGGLFGDEDVGKRKSKGGLFDD